jgi:hypothetical protein
MKNPIKTILPFLIVLVTLTVSCKKDKEDPAKAANLYFTYWDESSVNKIDLINTPNSIITLFDNTDGLLETAGIALTKDGFLIITEADNNRILKMQKNGSGNVVVLYDNSDGVLNPAGVAVDDATGTIYWSNSGTDQIMKGSTDGLTPPVTLYGGATVIQDAYGLAIDKKHGKLIISDFYNSILSGNLDGSGTPEVLWNDVKHATLGYPSGVCVDVTHNKIYWGDELSNEIVEANLDGTGTPVVLFDGSDDVSRADAVAIDYNSGKIYWTETTNNVVARGNLDGSGTREVLVSDVESYGLVLEFE